jgi:hypothetical protein
MKKGIDFRRMVGELLVIVIGVVAALGVDRWVQGIDDARAELEYLATGRRPSDSGLFMAVARAGTVNTVPAREGSFRDLETTGNVRLLSDHDLRSRVVGYFTQDIRFGRPIIEDRLDLRFRLFAREQVPVELDGHRSLCPSPTPSLECELDNPPSAESLWRALVENPSPVWR